MIYKSEPTISLEKVAFISKSDPFDKNQESGVKFTIDGEEEGGGGAGNSNSQKTGGNKMHFVHRYLSREAVINRFAFLCVLVLFIIFLICMANGGVLNSVEWARDSLSNIIPQLGFGSGSGRWDSNNLEFYTETFQRKYVNHVQPTASFSSVCTTSPPLRGSSSLGVLKGAVLVVSASLEEYNSGEVGNLLHDLSHSFGSLGLNKSAVVWIWDSVQQPGRRRSSAGVTTVPGNEEDGNDPQNRWKVTIVSKANTTGVGGLGNFLLSYMETGMIYMNVGYKTKLETSGFDNNTQSYFPTPPLPQKKGNPSTTTTTLTWTQEKFHSLLSSMLIKGKSITEDMVLVDMALASGSSGSSQLYSQSIYLPPHLGGILVDADMFLVWNTPQSVKLMKDMKDWEQYDSPHQYTTAATTEEVVNTPSPHFMLNSLLNFKRPSLLSVCPQRRRRVRRRTASLKGEQNDLPNTDSLIYRLILREDSM